MKSLESKYWALYRLLLVLVLTLATNSIAAQNLIKSATASIRFSKKDRSKWNPYNICTYMLMERKDEKTLFKFRSPGGMEKVVKLKRTN